MRGEHGARQRGHGKAACRVDQSRDDAGMKVAVALAELLTPRQAQLDQRPGRADDLEIEPIFDWMFVAAIFNSEF